MSLESETELIENELAFVKDKFLATVNLIPKFDITDSRVLPYGLKAHTRSIAWIVEQVITQQAKFNATKLGLNDVDFNMPDTCLHDCVLEKDEKRFFVNIKVHNVDGKNNKNDIAAVEKLYMQYSLNQNYRLIYACFGIKFENLTISFDKNYVHTFSPQFLPVYVNPRNDKIQAFYHHNINYRTRDTFLQLLREKSKSIVLE
jgi:hypothetical protein